MTWVKVCGISDVATLRIAEGAGADAVGLVLASSPRQVSTELATELADESSVATFIVTVDVTADRLIDLARTIGASGVQPHGAHAEAAAGLAQRQGFSILRPIAVSGPISLAGVPTGQTPLLDYYDERQHGGSGRTFDWSLVAEIDREFVLAGGLDPTNVALAVQVTGAWGVDASSRLESSPGTKDPELVRRFVREAKRS